MAMEPQEIVNRILEGKRKNIRHLPQYVTRASEIGHPCMRYLVYSITNWSDRKLHGPEVEWIFEGGRAVEELAIQDLIDAGFKVYRPEPDKAIMESKPRISGHVDVRVDFGDNIVNTVEVKGLNIIDFNRLNTLDDFLNSKKPWIKKYPGQLMTYMFIKGEDKGYFYLKSLPRFQGKIIPVYLDYSYMETLLKKTEEIDRHVKSETFPDKIDDPDTCEMCAFNHICLPDCNRESMEFIFDEELEEMLVRYEELKPLSSEFNDLWDSIKDRLNEQERLMIGKYMIQGKRVTTKAFEVKEKSYMKYKVINLDSPGKISI
jgi:hypothetical protein